MELRQWPRGRYPNRPACIGAHREENQVRRNRRARSAARPARDPFGVVRIPNGAEMRMVIGDPVGEFVHAGLAHEHGSGLGQFSVDPGIAVGNSFGEDFRSTGRADSARREKVFQPVGDAVERAAIDPAREIFIGSPGLLEREILGDGDEGVEPRLRFANAAKRLLGEFDRRDPARAEFGGASSIVNKG